MAWKQAVLLVPWLLLAAWAEVGGQVAGAAVKPDSAALEDRRQQLKKLDRWGLEQLLRTERAVDQEQKKRAVQSADPAELGRLAQDEDSEVRFSVAANPCTPLAAQVKLSADPFPLVRSGVAASLVWQAGKIGEEQKAGEEMALRLAGDSQVLVRFCLAGNENLPPPVLERLARDPDYLVRQKLAQNPQLPPGGVALLVQDSAQAVQAQALKHWNVPPEWLERMSFHPDAGIRLLVVEHPFCPSSVLARLATDGDSQVREAVARHPQATLEILRQMLNEPQAQVQLAIVQHPAADQGVLLRMASQSQDRAVRQEAQQRLLPFLREEIRQDMLERWQKP